MTTEPTKETPMSDEVNEVTQADRDAAAEWSFIECRHCSEYEGDFTADLAAAFARHRIQSEGRTGAGEALPKWVYDIQWGPEGQQDYAHVYDLGGNLIAVMKTHDAARIAKHRGGDQ